MSLASSNLQETLHFEYVFIDVDCVYCKKDGTDDDGLFFTAKNPLDTKSQCTISAQTHRFRDTALRFFVRYVLRKAADNMVVPVVWITQPDHERATIARELQSCAKTLVRLEESKGNDKVFNIFAKLCKSGKPNDSTYSRYSSCSSEIDDIYDGDAQNCRHGYHLYAYDPNSEFLHYWQKAIDELRDSSRDSEPIDAMYRDLFVTDGLAYDENSTMRRDYVSERNCSYSRVSMITIDYAHDERVAEYLSRPPQIDGPTHRRRLRQMFDSSRKYKCIDKLFRLTDDASVELYSTDINKMSGDVLSVVRHGLFHNDHLYAEAKILDDFRKYRDDECDVENAATRGNIDVNHETMLRYMIFGDSTLFSNELYLYYIFNVMLWVRASNE